MGGATLTTGSDNTSTLFAGTISGAGNLAKTGSGVFTLSGTNTYSGGTTVSDGTLIVTSPEAIDANGVGTNLYVGNDLSQFGTVLPAAQSAAVAASGLAPVPEPGTLALLAAAVLTLGIWRRKGGRGTCAKQPKTGCSAPPYRSARASPAERA